MNELLRFIFQSKKWYLIPILIILLVLGAVMVIGETSAVAPFIYALF